MVINEIILAKYKDIILVWYYRLIQFNKVVNTKQPMKLTKNRNKISYHLSTNYSMIKMNPLVDSRKLIKLIVNEASIAKYY